jgi:hypothetical protein
MNIVLRAVTFDSFVVLSGVPSVNVSHDVMLSGVADKEDSITRRIIIRIIFSY